MEKPCKSATFCQERFDIFLAWFSENTFVTTLMGFMYFSVMLSFSSKLGHIIKYNVRQHIHNDDMFHSQTFGISSVLDDCSLAY